MCSHFQRVIASDMAELQALGGVKLALIQRYCGRHALAPTQVLFADDSAHHFAALPAGTPLPCRTHLVAKRGSGLGEDEMRAIYAAATTPGAAGPPRPAVDRTASPSPLMRHLAALNAHTTETGGRRRR